MRSIGELLPLFLTRVGIERGNPNIVAPDVEMQQVRNCMQLAGDALALFPWPQLRKALAITDGSDSVALPADWNGVATQVIVRNVGAPAEYEPDEAMFAQQAATGAVLYRVEGSTLYLAPAAQSASAWYQSRDWLSSGSMISSNSDVVLLPDALFLLKAQVEWLRTKGLPFESEEREFTEQLTALLGPHVTNANDASHTRATA